MSSHSAISEWWDSAGDHHKGAPSADELLDEAVQVTGHIWDDDGNDLYFTSFSPDGWTEEEWADDVEDAKSAYL